MRRDELPDDREVDEMLSLLDHPVPKVSVEVVIERARTTRVDRLRWAAGVVLAVALAAGAAYAAPGSPVRGWIAEAGRALGLGSEATEPGVSPSPPPTPESGGISLVPGAALVIEFLEADLSGYARVDFTDDAEVVVRAPTGSTRFVSEPERLLVEHPTPDTVQVLIPRTGGRVTLRVGARELLRRNGEDVTATVPSTGDGGYVFRLGSGGG